jgi:hypothetical protein
MDYSSSHTTAGAIHDVDQYMAAINSVAIPARDSQRGPPVRVTRHTRQRSTALAEAGQPQPSRHHQERLAAATAASSSTREKLTALAQLAKSNAARAQGVRGGGGGRGGGASVVTCAEESNPLHLTRQVSGALSRGWVRAGPSLPTAVPRPGRPQSTQHELEPESEPEPGPELGQQQWRQHPVGGPPSSSSPSALSSSHASLAATYPAYYGQNQPAVSSPRRWSERGRGLSMGWMPAPAPAPMQQQQQQQPQLQQLQQPATSMQRVRQQPSPSSSSPPPPPSQKQAAPRPGERIWVSVDRSQAAAAQKRGYHAMDDLRPAVPTVTDWATASDDRSGLLASQLPASDYYPSSDVPVPEPSHYRYRGEQPTVVMLELHTDSASSDEESSLASPSPQLLRPSHVTSRPPPSPPLVDLPVSGFRASPRQHEQRENGHVSSWSASGTLDQAAMARQAQADPVDTVVSARVSPGQGRQQPAVAALGRSPRRQPLTAVDENADAQRSNGVQEGSELSKDAFAEADSIVSQDTLQASAEKPRSRRRRRSSILNTSSNSGGTMRTRSRTGSSVSFADEVRFRTTHLPARSDTWTAALQKR